MLTWTRFWMLGTNPVMAYTVTTNGRKMVAMIKATSSPHLRRKMIRQFQVFISKGSYHGRPECPV